MNWIRGYQTYKSKKCTVEEADEIREVERVLENGVAVDLEKRDSNEAREVRGGDA